MKRLITLAVITALVWVYAVSDTVLVADATPAIEARIRELVPDLPWNGSELVFPSNP